MIARHARHGVAGFAAALAVTIGGCVPPPLAPEAVDADLRFVDRPTVEGYGSVDVLGLPPRWLRALDEARPTTSGWQLCFVVHTIDEAGTPGPLPVVGRYVLQPDAVRFRPRFPPAAGVTYRARFDPTCVARLIDPRAVPVEVPAAWRETSWRVPSAVGEAPRVVAVYPTRDVLPANQLKLYIHFSKPMARGDAYRHVRLVDLATGEEVEAPFLALGEELWDAEQRRFTLFFDPGRIKRGLRPHAEAGPPLVAGGRYRFEIASTWTDGAGAPLAASFAKTFAVVDADRTAPDAATWNVVAPPVGTTSPLVLAFSEPMDHGLLLRVLRVRDDQGRAVAGVPSVATEETVWRFEPSEPWRNAEYQLEVETILEDLAGNNLRGVFDREDASIDRATVGVTTRAEAVHLTFRPRRPMG